MTSLPLVTIVIPVYNGADYLGEAIESALAQSYPAVEVLVIDDGSTDRGATAAVAHGFGSRIRYVRKENGGVATALNLGIELMRGSLFSWLSHDDLYVPDKLERQVASMQGFGAPCVVVGDFDAMDAHGAHLSSQTLKGWNLVARPLDAVFNGLINGCTLLIPRHLFRRVGVFESGLPTTQDYDLWYRLASGVPFVHCPHVAVRQRIHPMQGSRQASHIDEAGRLFANFIDRTPTEVMRAYGGTELRFLLGLRRPLSPYPGAGAYLDFRIGQWLRSVKVGGLLIGPSANADGAATLEGCIAQVATSSGSVAASIEMGNTPALRMVRGLRSLSANGSMAPRFAFVGASGNLSPEAMRRALETILLQNADVVVPAAPDGSAPLLDGLLVRVSAATVLEEAVSPEGEIDWPRLARLARLEHGPAPGPAIAIIPPQSPAEHARRYSPGAMDEELSAFQGPPALLLLTDPSSAKARAHLDHLVAGLRETVRLLVVQAQGDDYFNVYAPQYGDYPTLSFQLPAQAGELREVVRRFGVSRMDLHHTAGFERIAEPVLAALDLPLDVTWLGCLPAGRPAPSYLQHAQRVIVFTRASAVQAQAALPKSEVIYARHWTAPRQHVFSPRLWQGEALRVLLLDDVEEPHERRVVVESAMIVASRRLPIRFHLFGTIPLAPLEVEAVEGVLIRHDPKQRAFFEAVGGVAPHVAWLPTDASEGWSYELSAVMDLALPLSACDVEPVSERCVGRPFTWLLAPRSEPEVWVRHFLELHATELRLPACGQTCENAVMPIISALTIICNHFQVSD